MPPRQVSGTEQQSAIPVIAVVTEAPKNLRHTNSLGAEEQGKGALRVQRVRGELDWLHNLWGPLQNETVRLLVKKLLRKKSIKNFKRVTPER